MSFVYLVAGSGPDEAALRSRAGELGVGSLVRWLGHVPESRLADLYRASDLFLLCTREAEEQRQVEGFGLVLLEAQACGVPVVATRTGGIPDAVREGGGGWLIDEGDAARLSEILSDLVRDPELFHEAGRQARKRIEREATLEGYIDRFEAALAAGGQPLA